VRSVSTVSKQAAKARQAAIELALSYPEAWQDEPWENDVLAKVGDRKPSTPRTR